MSVVPGCSGSGLFNENVELVGVVWGKYAEGGTEVPFFGNMGGNDIAIFEPIQDINKFLKEIEQTIK